MTPERRERLIAECIAAGRRSEASRGEWMMEGVLLPIRELHERRDEAARHAWLADFRKREGLESLPLFNFLRDVCVEFSNKYCLDDGDAIVRVMWVCASELRKEEGFGLFYTSCGDMAKARFKKSLAASDAQSAKENYERSNQLLEQLSGAGDRGIAWNYYSLGMLALNQHEYALAGELFEKGLPILERCGPSQSELARIHQHMGFAQSQLGRPIETRHHSRKALDAWFASVIALSARERHERLSRPALLATSGLDVARELDDHAFALTIFERQKGLDAVTELLDSPSADLEAACLREQIGALGREVSRLNDEMYDIKGESEEQCQARQSVDRVLNASKRKNLLQRIQRLEQDLLRHVLGEPISLEKLLGDIVGQSVSSTLCSWT